MDVLHTEHLTFLTQQPSQPQPWPWGCWRPAVAVGMVAPSRGHGDDGTQPWPWG